MSENKAIDKANLELALSENNKKLLEYTDNADTKLRQEFGPVSKYQKYLNTELDYAHVLFSKETTVNNATVGTVIPFDKVIASNNIAFDSSINAFILKAGKTYKITSNLRMSSPTGGYFYFLIRNKTKGVYLGAAGCVETPKSYSIYVANKPAEAIIKCDEDTEIQAVVCSIDTTRTLAFTTSCSMLVQEINRQIVIDPVEHVNTEYGLEDAPVGHIISHMGTKAPKHYLMCDGSEYDILLYPELANHILDNFGSYNYFGGDGVNTFAIPDLRERFLKGSETAGVNEEAGLPNITANWKSEPSADTHGAVWDTYEKGTLQGVTSGGSSDSRLHFDASRSSSVYGNSDTVTPANTSVLYCIKYEHTYYTKVNNTNYLSASLYSEEERVIGCWIDGKPLYEKTIKYENVSCAKGSYSKIGTVSNAIQNYEHVLNYMAYSTILKRNIAIGGFAPTSSFKIYGYSCTIQPDSSNDSITVSASSDSNIMSNDTLFVTFQYTKTTDAENSFTEDMIKDYISSTSNEDISYTDAEIQAIIKEGVAEINEEA